MWRPKLGRMFLNFYLTYCRDEGLFRKSVRSLTVHDANIERRAFLKLAAASIGILCLGSSISYDPTKPIVHQDGKIQWKQLATNTAFTASALGMKLAYRRYKFALADYNVPSHLLLVPPMRSHYFLIDGLLLIYIPSLVVLYMRKKSVKESFSKGSKIEEVAGETKDSGKVVGETNNSGSSMTSANGKKF